MSPPLHLYLEHLLLYTSLQQPSTTPLQLYLYVSELQYSAAPVDTLVCGSRTYYSQVGGFT